MIFSLCFALARADEEVLGTYSYTGEFLPAIPKTSIDGRAVFIDYENNRVPTSNNFARFTATFKTLRAEPYQLREIIGHIYDPKTHDQVSNFSVYITPGPLKSEDEVTHNCFLRTSRGDFETGKFIVDIYALLSDETGQNCSLLIFNDSCEFYEVTDYMETAITLLIYVSFIAVVGAILYVIFTKQNISGVVSANKDKKKPKKQVRDYADVHNVSDRSSSPGTGSGKGGRKNSPGSRSSGSGKAKKN